MQNKVDQFIAFCSGDLLVTIITLQGFSFYDESWHFAIKAFVTLILGFLGGMGGLIAKEILPIIKKWGYNKFIKK